jgi:predicted ATPase/DNA-binding SARP family transcriptional activator
VGRDRRGSWCDKGVTKLGDPPHLRVRLFGRVRIGRGGDEISLPTRKAELLLAYLLLHPGPRSRERTAALFWGDSSDSSARASLRNCLSTLRREIDRDLLKTDRDTVEVASDFAVWVDALELRSQATRYLEDPSPRPDRVQVDLYENDLLVDFYDDWVITQREELRTLYLDSLLELAQQLRSASDYDLARRFSALVIDHDPPNERAHRCLMFCHVALGNRDAALRQFEACRTALREELDVSPSEATKRLHQWIQNAPFERTPVDASATNLPIPATSFVGREEEMATVKGRLASERLVTLTGAGGSGKTRLAIQVATDLLDAFDDGVWWVELGSLTDGELLPWTVAKALGVPEVQDEPITDTLARFVGARNLLLVLDNCEHLIGACARLTEHLLGRARDLRVLATSRELLGIDGESVQRVRGLSSPRHGRSPLADELLDYGAVRLFVGRATSFDPGFVLTDENASHVAGICARLEGLPLAIELAAARVRALSVEDMAGRIDDAFELLGDSRRTAPPRHRTLHAAVAWSYDLLSDDEALLFRRLSVFVGGWTLAAAETVCSGAGLAPTSVTRLLAQLVDKSLVEIQSRGDERRYRMLETIRAYSCERLADSGEIVRLRDRHLDHYRELAEAADPHLGYFLPNAEVDAWTPRIRADFENVRTAVEWSLDHPEDSDATVEDGLQIGGNLHWFWFAEGRFAEGHSWLLRTLESAGDQPPDARALGLLTAGYLACWQGDFASARPHLDGARVHFAQLRDDRGTAFALHGLGFAAMGQGELGEALTLLEESRKHAEEVGDAWLLSFAHHFVGIVLAYMGDYEAAASHFDEGNGHLAQMGGHRQGLAFSLFHYARIARLTGDHADARSRLERALTLFREANDLRGIGYVLAGLAVLATAEGDLPRAARLFGTTESIQSVLGSFLETPLQMEYDEHLASTRTELDDKAFSAARSDGIKMTVDQAIGYAIG